MAMVHWPTVNNITALAGGGQTGATEMRGQSINRVTTVATAADSVLLPTAINGKMLLVKNAAAANSMNVFPRSGEAINALSANTAFAMAAGKAALFFCAADGTWEALLTA